MKAGRLKFSLLIAVCVTLVTMASASYAAVAVDNQYNVNTVPVHPVIRLVAGNDTAISSSSMNAYNSSYRVVFTSNHVTVVNASNLAYFSDGSLYPINLTAIAMSDSVGDHVARIVIYAISQNSAYNTLLNLSFYSGNISSVHNYSITIQPHEKISIGEKIIMNSSAESSLTSLKIALPYYVGNDGISYVGSSYELSTTNEYGIFY
ncbi:MAG: hypothetical protein QXN26_06050 [Thermoplasmataceae archaeon]